MYTIICDTNVPDFIIISKEECCYYNNGNWADSINELNKKYSHRNDSINNHENLDDYLKYNNFTTIIDIPTLDYAYIETNYPELLI